MKRRNLTPSGCKWCLDLALAGRRRLQVVPASACISVSSWAARSTSPSPWIESPGRAINWATSASGGDRRRPTCTCCSCLQAANSDDHPPAPSSSTKAVRPPGARAAAHVQTDRGNLLETMMGAFALSIVRRGQSAISMERPSGGKQTLHY
jgi:hypothetical protein